MCRYCEDQKETFGAGADIPYVECFPAGWEKGTPLATACSAAGVTGRVDGTFHVILQTLNKFNG